ncbi:unnamed protein product [Schistosoma mattheei]|uniref:Uncharacterized protein n=1 Tax=Schistosoma mattheei TaxID=31246 RepID=A0A183PEH7_9TREM|nr:unnamed protein product [Schistosoma mattheei]
MESSRPKEKRKTKEHITPGKGDKHEKNEQELDRSGEEGPRQNGLEDAPPRQPQSDRLGKKCVPTLGCAAASVNLNDPEELEKCIDNVLVQHRNVEHLRNNDGPAYLFKFCILPTHSVNKTSLEIQFRRENDY